MNSINITFFLLLILLSVHINTNFCKHTNRKSYMIFLFAFDSAFCAPQKEISRSTKISRENMTLLAHDYVFCAPLKGIL
jgi:hypothetical protein